MYDRPTAMKPRVPSVNTTPGGPQVGSGIPPGTGGIRPPMPPQQPPGGPSPGPIPFQTGGPTMAGTRPRQGPGLLPQMGTVGSMNAMPPRMGGGGPTFGGGPTPADGPRFQDGGPQGNPTMLPPMGPRGGPSMQPPMSPPAMQGGGLAPGLPPGAYGNMPKPGGGNLPGQAGNPYDTSMPDDWRRRAQRQSLA